MESLLVLTLLSSLWAFLAGSACCQRPAVVNIGAVFTFDSIIGRAAKVAMEAAVSDVNADPSILNGTKLNLVMADTHCNVLVGSIGGTSLYTYFVHNLLEILATF